MAIEILSDGIQIAANAGAGKVFTSDSVGVGTWQASSGASETFAFFMGML